MTPGEINMIIVRKDCENPIQSKRITIISSVTRQ